MDFTLTKYKDLLKAIKDSQHDVYGIHDWFQSNPEHGILIRHDIDRRAANAIDIAQLEADHGFSTTYYFRITPGSFKPEVIKQVKDLGHEIGYHYEDLSIANGDTTKAIELFQDNLKRFEDLVEIKTIAMHGRPLSKYTNKDLWNFHDFKNLGIEADAFLSIDYSNTYYFTDTGRSWSNKSLNLRDKVNGLQSEVGSTDELIDFIYENKRSKIALVTHPERWNEVGLNFVYSWGMDMGANLIKYFLRNLYKNK